MRAAGSRASVGVGMPRPRRTEVEPDPAGEVASLGRYRLRFSDAAVWSYEAVNALSDDEVIAELDRLDAERQREAPDAAA